MSDWERERRRILALLNYRSHRSSMLYLRKRAFRWVDLLPTPEAQERATAAIADASTPHELRLILEEF